MGHQLSSATLIVIGIFVGLFWGGACGGGSGGGGAIAAPQAQVNNRIHVSTQGGVVATPGDAITVVREITYVPSSVNDVILQVIVDGTYDKTGSQTGNIYVELFDSNDRMIGLGGTQINNPGNGVAFAMSFSPQPGVFSQDAEFPSTSYKVRLTVNTAGVTTFVGQIVSTRFRIITLENVTVDSPSTKITG